MKDYVFCFWLCCIVTLVASNPAAQRQSPKQRQNKNPVPYQAPASKSRPSNQNVKVQNQTPNLGNFDGALLNDLLMTKIFGNPSLQKILDPNTKLYKQNGQEIHRQPNPGVPPSVVNNYFIVPPEFFSIKSDKTGTKSKNKVNLTKKNNPSNKLAEIKTKPKVTKAKENLKVKNDVEIVDQTGNSRTKKTEKKPTQAKSAKLVEQTTESNTNKEDKNSQTGDKKTKRRRKQNNSTKLEQSTPIKEDTKVDIEKEVFSPKNTTSKRRRKSKIRPEVTNEQIVHNTTITKEDLSPNVEIINSPHIEKPSQTETIPKLAKLIEEPTKDARMKTIELLPNNRDNQEKLVKPTLPLDNNIRTSAPQSEKKQNTEVPRNPKKHRVTHDQRTKNSPVTDDVLKYYFPYMYMGNNYPFNFEHLYQPYLNTNSNAKNNKTKTKARQNTNIKNKTPLPNVVELKSKQKKHNVTTTTEKPMSAETIEDSSETRAESVEQLSDTRITEIDNLRNQKQIVRIDESPEVTNIEIDEHKVISDQNYESSEEVNLPEFTLPKKETGAPKASLEMPPNVIEDLHDFMIPELGREDIMPTAHTNGIISDYYPIFNDDSYYASEEKFFREDLEDERHFYTTDRGFEDLNRERRTFDKHDDYLNSNIDFVDRVNFRKAFKYRERDKTESEYDNNAIKNINGRVQTNEVHKIKLQSEKMTEKNETEAENIIEDQFQTPPLLENPDFQTRQIERLSPVYDPNIHYTNEPVNMESTESESDIPIHSYIDTKPIQYSRLVFDTDFEKENHVSYIDNLKGSTTKKPMNDRIETVYAKSRVVKYGVAKAEDDILEHFPVIENGADKFYGDGQTTYVLAKSLGKAEDYFW